MLTYRTGAAGVPGVAKSMAEYLISQTQVPEIQAKLASYYGKVVAEGLEQSAGIPRENMHPSVAALLGIDVTRALTEQEVAHLLTGLRADGQAIEGKQIQASTKERTRIAYADFTLSAPKSFSVALAMAPTDAERAMLDRAHRKAVEMTMQHVASQIGLARKGKGGSKGWEEGHVAWFSFDHYTARPTLKMPVLENGIHTTELVTVKVAGDPQRHTHVIIPNVVLTDSGRVTGFFQDRIKSRVHEWGSIYQAFLGTELRKLGVGWELDSDPAKSMNQRMGRLTDVPRWASDLFSKRTQDGEEAARDYAARHGADWDSLSASAKAKMMKGGTAKTRQYKTEFLSDYQAWLRQAEDAGYNHRSVLRPDAKIELAPRKERLQAAYALGIEVLDPEMQRRSTFEGSLARVSAAKGLIEHGIESPSDISVITAAYRTEGIKQNGDLTHLLWGKSDERDQFASFTTALHVDQENEAIGLLRAAAQDKSASITKDEIDAAIVRVVAGAAAKGKKLDFTTGQGKLQRDMAYALASGGRAAVGVGVHGAGKTELMSILIEAAHARGRETFGVTVAWRQSHALADAGVGRSSALKMVADTSRLEDAGISNSHAMAMTGFLYRAQRGMLKLDRNTDVYLDEIAQIDTHQILALSRLQQKHGFKINGLGDDLQCQSIGAGNTVRLFRKALGEDQVPAILETIRQETERDRKTALMFRDEHAAEALARKEEDGTLIIAQGGYKQAVEAAVDLLLERRAANAGDPRYVVAMSAPSNADVMAIGTEVRRRRQASGDMGPDMVVIDAADQMKHNYKLALAVGDRLRLFNKVKDGRGDFGDNGTIVDVLQVHPSHGLTLQNDQGRVAVIPWDKLRNQDTGMIQIAYGDALTIDARQGDTVHEHISFLGAGSKLLNGYKAYTTESRHRIKSWIVASMGEEMMEIITRRPLGDPRNILDTPQQVREAVMANMARNMSQHPEKQLATDFVELARDVREGEIDARMADWHRQEVAAQKSAAPEPAAERPQQVQQPVQQAATAQQPAPPAPGPEVTPAPPHPGPEAAVVPQSAEQGPPPGMFDDDAQHHADETRHPDELADPQLETAKPQPVSADPQSVRQPAKEEIVSEMQALAAFKSQMEAIGLRPDGELRADGKIHYTAVTGLPNSKKRGSYKITLGAGTRIDPHGGWARNNDTQQTTPLKVSGHTGVAPLSEKEIQERAAIRAERAAAGAAHANKLQDDAAQIAKAIWSGAVPTSEHPYLIRKGVEAHGLRTAAKGQYVEGVNEDGKPYRANIAGQLIVPMLNADGELRGIQRISDAGKKLYLADAQKQGLFAVIGEIKPDKPHWEVEGYATGAALVKTTGIPAVVAFDSTNLMPVAKIMKEMYPDSYALRGADNDHHLPGVKLNQASGSDRNLAVTWEQGSTGKAPQGDTARFRVVGDTQWTTASQGIRGNHADIRVPVAEARYEVEIFASHRNGPMQNEGIVKATAAARAHGGTVITPKFERGAPGTDWQDKFAADGKDATKQAIEDEIEAAGLADLLPLPDGGSSPPPAMSSREAAWTAGHSSDGPTTAQQRSTAAGTRQTTKSKTKSV